MWFVCCFTCVWTICTVCVCVCQYVSWWISRQGGGRGGGGPFVAWTEPLKPKQTVANSPAAWLLLQIVLNDRTTDYHDHSLHTSSSSSSPPCFLYTRHQSQFHYPAAPCSRKHLQSETSKWATLRLKLAPQSHSWWRKKNVLSPAQRVSCESTGCSVGAVPLRSWLSCVRNLDKSKNKN